MPTRQKKAADPAADKPPRRATAKKPEAAPAAAPRPARKSRSAPARDRAQLADGAKAAASAAPTPEPSPEPRAPRARRPRRKAAAPQIQAPDDGSPFGGWTVTLPGEGPERVQLRSATEGTAWCSCLDFALSEDARCPHVALAWAEAMAHAGWAAGPAVVASRLAVRHGARARLLWLPGRECPAGLQTLAEEAIALPPDAQDERLVTRLVRAAREAGHTLQVDDAVWALVASRREAASRVQRLEQALPEGPSAAALQDLRPLLPVQWEGALFATCAGRCVLADAAPLQPREQAVAALRLQRALLGLRRALVLAPEAALGGWRSALAGDDGGALDASAEHAVALMALERVADDVERHRALDPELVIVDEPPDGGLWVDAERAAALLRLPVARAIVLPGPGWEDRPAEWPLRLAFVDALRSGAYAALVDRHGERDAEGQLCGLQHLEGLRDTLEPVLLARPLEAVRARLPERIDRVLEVAPTEAEAHDLRERTQALRAEVAHWSAAGWCGETDQRRLLAELQSLRRAAGGLQAKAQAVVQTVLQAATAADPGPWVVFSQWAEPLAGLAAALGEAGVACTTWQPERPAGERAAAAAALAEGRCTVLLVVDGAGLELHHPGARVLHLDVSWHPRQALRRFARVHRRGQAHLVPVVQLVAAGTLEARLVALAEQRDPPDWADAEAAAGFVPAEQQAAWLADLAALLG